MQKSDVPEVSTQAILQSVSAQGFLITQTVISSQDVTYTVDQGSDWSNFWWGHEITAEATMQSHIGIDLSQMSEKDVVADSRTKTVCFRYPTPEIKETVIIGDIEVMTKSGILKKLLASDTNNDYNIALAQLKTNAQKAAATLPNMSGEAFANADKVLSFIVSETGYRVAPECRK